MPARVAARAAYVAAALNLAAGVATLLLLREGLPAPGTTPGDRLAYVAGQTVAWRAGWLCWHAAALALLAFYVALAGRWWRRAPIRCGAGVLCAAAGLAVDLGAQGVYMGVAPHLSPEAFAVAEAVAGVLTGYAGNGLYTLAGMLLTWAGIAELPGLLLALSAPVWAAGLCLSAASLAGSSAGQFWSTAILIPSFVLWSGLMGRWFSTKARQAMPVDPAREHALAPSPDETRVLGATRQPDEGRAAREPRR